jgi:hypothetical protein
VGTKIPQLLPQLQTPEQNDGASPIDAQNAGVDGRIAMMAWRMIGPSQVKLSIGDEMKMKGTNKKTDVSLPPQQLQTPEQNGGAAPKDALTDTATVG